MIAMLGISAQAQQAAADSEGAAPQNINSASLRVVNNDAAIIIDGNYSSHVLRAPAASRD